MLQEKEHESKSHPVALLGRVLPDGEMNYHPVEKEVLALLLALKTCYTTLDSKRLMQLVAQRVPEKDVAFAQLLQSTVTIFVELEDSLAPVTPPSQIWRQFGPVTKRLRRLCAVVGRSSKIRTMWCYGG
ncbi:hypothetical protein L914_14592 [Phytophthora nicotianae]|uniref:Reverse transcriptase RNase H-like domain-containing protein n=1 Tax=Phytophthora nicotianae TaxID=4792 RepID=W2MSC5_PHYNI|nr:hypothetical protein L914_14592 [Phytophthora nicotianae]